jgi:MFS transporter, DHA1 family, tetracycline resistance protein
MVPGVAWEAALNRAFILILMTIALDSAGVGLIMPVLPSLLRDLSIAENVALLLGLVIGSYALMQFLFAPVVGALSDRFGRRPILLVALAATAVDYLIMAATPWFWLLLVTRALAGVLAASMTASMAYIADISEPDIRSRRFGLAYASLGLGFIFGPLTGGVLGEVWVRLPFLLAAVFAALNFTLALIALPESRAGHAERMSWDALNPLTPLSRMFQLRVLLPVLAVIVVVKLVNQSYGTVLVIFQQDRFLWGTGLVGLAVSLFGVAQMVAMGTLPGPVAHAIGDRHGIMLGMALEMATLLALSVLTSGTVALLLAPLVGIAGISGPLLQSVASKAVPDSEQGQLQGVLTALGSLAAIVGPFAFSAIYAASSAQWNGIVWVIDAVMYLAVLPVCLLIPMPSKLPRPA